MNDQSLERAIVTGGAGFIGSHVVEALVAQGSEVIVIDDLSSGKAENIPPEATLYRLDIRSPEAARILTAFGAQTPHKTALIHLAAQMEVRRSVADPAFDAQINILGLIGMLEAARAAGPLRIVFASSGGVVYGKQQNFPAGEDDPLGPLCPYGVSKLAGEFYLRFYAEHYGLATTALRFANVYGPRQNPHGEAGVVAIFASKLAEQRAPMIYGDGAQTRDYVYVGDVVAATLAAAEREQGFCVYNVGTGIETSVSALYALIRQEIGSEIEAIHGPPRPGDLARSVVSSAKLQADLGVAIETHLKEGLHHTLPALAAARRPK